MKQLLILGGGVSGNAALRLAAKLGMNARIVSDQDSCDPATIFSGIDAIIVSPGMHRNRSALRRLAEQSKLPCLSEMEFGFRHYPGTVLAVTGTNGKTTTTEMTTHFLRALGVNAESVGNIGRPLSDLAAEPNPASVAVAEVSSFQLELTQEFAPKAAVLLNLGSDHVDCYEGGMEEYIRMKMKIFDRVPETARIFGCSMPQPCQRHVTRSGNILSLNGQRWMEVPAALQGEHNLENLAAALELVLRLIPSPDRKALSAAVSSFRIGRHRQEIVREKDGVIYVDDSKATNPASVVAACKAFRERAPLVLLLGGLDKGMDFTELEAIREWVQCAILYGEASNTIAQSCVNYFPCLQADTFPEAVQLAARHAKCGSAVLLSPACASFDLFPGGYAERGDRFRQLVEEL
ncbi:MAG: UDP-N-acetylmuramoyl-L-alanine--D-glutamate ligase [Victivallaceae bacterium]|nr:UDP-N-acetylmuramoyl-L-alanine--D-glutamate ligase [Victivallaceae bacterium]